MSSIARIWSNQKERSSRAGSHAEIGDAVEQAAALEKEGAEEQAAL